MVNSVVIVDVMLVQVKAGAGGGKKQSYGLWPVKIVSKIKRKNAGAKGRREGSKASL